MSTMGKIQPFFVFLSWKKKKIIMHENETVLYIYVRTFCIILFWTDQFHYFFSKQKAELKVLFRS